MTRPPPISTLFPSTPLSRSRRPRRPAPPPPPPPPRRWRRGPLAPPAIRPGAASWPRRRRRATPWGAAGDRVRPRGTLPEWPWRCRAARWAPRADCRPPAPAGRRAPWSGAGRRGRALEFEHHGPVRRGHARREALPVHVRPGVGVGAVVRGDGGVAIQPIVADVRTHGAAGNEAATARRGVGPRVHLERHVRRARDGDA